MKITKADVVDFILNKSENFNELTPAQTERLAILIEELSEAQHIASKILRHGYDSRNPLHPEVGINKMLLQDELGHVQHSIAMLVNAGDVSQGAINAQQGHKERNIKPYLHHQEQVA